jgi:hypothetical protein
VYLLMVGRYKHRQDPMPERTVAELRRELHGMGFRGLSRLTKIELTLKLSRENKRLVRKARVIAPSEGPVLQ